MLIIRDSLNTHSIDSSTLFSELDGDANLDDLDNRLSDFYTSSDHVQQNGVSHASYVFPARNSLGSFRTDKPRKSIREYNRLSTVGQCSPEYIECERESFEPTCSEVIRQKAQKIERNHRIEIWRLE